MWQRLAPYLAGLRSLELGFSDDAPPPSAAPQLHMLHPTAQLQDLNLRHRFLHRRRRITYEEETGDDDTLVEGMPADRPAERVALMWLRRNACALSRHPITLVFVTDLNLCPARDGLPSPMRLLHDAVPQLENLCLSFDAHNVEDYFSIDDMLQCPPSRPAGQPRLQVQAQATTDSDVAPLFPCLEELEVFSDNEIIATLGRLEAYCAARPGLREVCGVTKLWVTCACLQRSTYPGVSRLQRNTPPVPPAESPAQHSTTQCSAVQQELTDPAWECPSIHIRLDRGGTYTESGIPGWASDAHFFKLQRLPVKPSAVRSIKVDACIGPWFPGSTAAAASLQHLQRLLLPLQAHARSTRLWLTYSCRADGSERLEDVTRALLSAAAGPLRRQGMHVDVIVWGRYADVLPARRQQLWSAFVLQLARDAPWLGALFIYDQHNRHELGPEFVAAQQLLLRGAGASLQLTARPSYDHD